MPEERKDLCSAVFFAVLSIAYLIGSLSISNYSGVYGANSFGSAVIPRVIGLLVLCISILLMVRSIKKIGTSGTADQNGKSNFPSEEVEKTEQNNPAAVPKTNKKLVILSLALLCFYTLLLDTVGFMIMTSVYLIAQMLLLSSGKIHLKNIVRIAVLSIAFSVAVYFLFVRGFSLLLPAGILG